MTLTEKKRKIKKYIKEIEPNVRFSFFTKRFNIKAFTEKNRLIIFKYRNGNRKCIDWCIDIDFLEIDSNIFCQRNHNKETQVDITKIMGYDFEKIKDVIDNYHFLYNT